MRSLVNGENYVTARSVNEARDASAQIVGSPVAGFLYSLVLFLPFLVSAIGQAIAILSSFFLPSLPPKSEPEDQPTGPKEGFMSRALAGFRWILKSRQMTALTALAVVVNVGTFLLMSSVTLMLLANGTDTTVIGFVVTAEAAGVILGSPLAAHFTNKIPTWRLLLVTNLASVLFLLPIVFSQNLVLIGVCYFFWGLCVPVTNASLGGYLFQLVPTDIQGRVVAAHTLVAGIPVALTSMIAGSMVDAGWGVWAIASGVVCAMLGLSILFIERSLLAIPRPADWPSEVPD